MTTTNITRSPGIAINGTGLIAGGGGKGATATLDSTVQAAAEALSALYPGAPVAIRFNSDRRSGGAWLKTAEQDGIGKNAEVGITAYIATSTKAIHVMTYLSTVGTEDNINVYRETESVEAAAKLIGTLAVPTFAELVDRIARNALQFADKYIRYVLIGRLPDGQQTMAVEPHTEEGKAELERLTQSRAKANASFPSYIQPHAARIKDGELRVSGAYSTGSGWVAWADAREVESGVVYADGGRVEIARDGKLIPTAIAA